MLSTPILSQQKCLLYIFCEEKIDFDKLGWVERVITIF